MIQTYKITVTTTGAAGSATGSTTSSDILIGTVLGIYLDYVAQPATADVTIATTGTPAETILTVTNANTDSWFYVQHNVVHPDASVLANMHTSFVIADYVTVSVAQGDAGSVIAYIKMEN